MICRNCTYQVATAPQSFLEPTYFDTWISGAVIITVRICVWQAGRAVVLVAVMQGAAHYQQALRKLVRNAICRGSMSRSGPEVLLHQCRHWCAGRPTDTWPGMQGVNMAAHMRSGQLTIIDTMTDIDILSEAELHAGAPQLIACMLAAVGRAQQQQQPNAAAVGADAGTAAGVVAQPDPVSSTNGRHALPDASSNAVRWPDGQHQHQQQSQPTVCVLVDDLTAVGSLTADNAGWQGLLKQLLAMVTSEQQPDHFSNESSSHRTDGSATSDLISGPVSLCVLLHADVEDAAAAELLTSDAASVIVDIEPLTAGQSADVSGRMNMQLRDCTAHVPWGISETDCQRCFFVKASDRGVRFLQQYTAA